MHSKGYKHTEPLKYKEELHFKHAFAFNPYVHSPTLQEISQFSQILFISASLNDGY